MTSASTIGFLPREDLHLLLDLLREDGRQIIGPTVADDAIVYDEITSIADLPAGYGAEQSPGSYRLLRRSDERLFDYAVGPTAWKRFVHPPVLALALSRRNEDGSISFERPPRDYPKLAFLGVRACELAALGIEDRVFLSGDYTDEDYRTRRQSAIVVAVQCAAPASTCFCTSMGTGPAVRGGHDISMIELDEGFVVTPGTPVGASLLQRLPLGEATADQLEAASSLLAAAREKIGDPLEATGLHDRLLVQLDSPRWAEIAERCTACGNCTMVCPTCFCYGVNLHSDLDGHEAITERVWDSCFKLGFAKIVGGNFRTRIQDRYRQWLTHKFATWYDQFGTSGCVGCGRCVTWCPVAIDVREELNAIAPPPAKLAGESAVLAVPHAAQPVVARVVASRRETHDTVTLTLSVPGIDWSTAEGEFVMVTLPAIGSLPISIARRLPDGMDLTIRAAGPATTVLAALEPGGEVGITGPMGRGWPVHAAYDRDVVIVGGGMGLAPLRPLIDEVLAERDKFGDVRLYYGARTPSDLLYTDELAAWSARSDVEAAVTVDRGDAEWLGRVGIVTQLFDRARWDGSKAIAFVVGPERMAQATVSALAARGLTPDRIYVSMERHMECGVGLCGHCQMGPFFICKDGPVFSLAQLGDTFGREGI
ncbi:MAG: 4Fe-4S dicluster domain-containing protein [Candidatus Limnocylindria bacterium]